MSSLSEIQGRLNVSLQYILSFFESQGLLDNSIKSLNQYSTKHLTSEFLSLSESFGKCMVFIDHDELCRLLHNSWTLYYDALTIDRKLTLKRLKVLREDKKADLTTVTKLETHLANVEEKKTSALVNMTRIRCMMLIPVEKFRSDENFDFKLEYEMLQKNKIS